MKPQYSNGFRIIPASFTLSPPFPTPYILASIYMKYRIVYIYTDRWILLREISIVVEGSQERDRSIVYSTMLQWSAADTSILSVYLSVFLDLPSPLNLCRCTCDYNTPASRIDPFSYRKFRDWNSCTGSIDSHNSNCMTLMEHSEKNGSSEKIVWLTVFGWFHKTFLLSRLNFCSVNQIRLLESSKVFA